MSRGQSAMNLNGKGVSRATLSLTDWGVPSARVELADPTTFAVGARASLTIGDLTVSCAVRSGGTYLDVSSYQLVAGADGWSSIVAKRPHRTDTGVRLSDVARAVAADCGETIVVDPSAERVLGYAWARPAGVASAVLGELVGQAWWVGVDGVTHVGVRPSPVVKGKFAIESWDPAELVAVVSEPDDKIAQLMPGARFTQDGVDLLIRDVTITADSGSIRVELCGLPGLADLLVAARQRRLDGLYQYRVVEQVSGRLSLQTVGYQQGLPDMLYIDQAHGAPGATHVLAPSSIVLVAFAGGDLASPIVAHYLGSPNPLPVSVAVDASSEVRFGGAGAEPVARGDRTDDRIEQLRIGLNSARLLVGLGPVAALESVGADKVLAE